MIPNQTIQQSKLKSIVITDMQPQSDYVASIKISRQPNGKILGASVFIPGDFIAGLVGTADSVKLIISNQDNNIILTPV
jgi:hypothetical protein